MSAHVCRGQRLILGVFLYCSTLFSPFGFQNRVFLQSIGCPQASSVDQAGLELKELLASRVLRLKVCTTTAQCTLHLFIEAKSFIWTQSLLILLVYLSQIIQGSIVSTKCYSKQTSVHTQHLQGCWWSNLQSLWFCRKNFISWESPQSHYSSLLRVSCENMSMKTIDQCFYPFNMSTLS